jgi:tryptophan 2,3-dioxygenase
MPPTRPPPSIDYGSYLALDELLALQQPRSAPRAAPEHPDELLFIVVHQASELWFKVHPARARRAARLPGRATRSRRSGACSA